MHVPAALAAGHAPFAWGVDAGKAVDNAVALEASARMTVITGALTGGKRPLLEDWVLAKHHQRKHGDSAYYGQGKP